MGQTGEEEADPRALYLPVALVSASFAFLNIALPMRVAELGGGGIGVGAVFSAFTAFLLLARPLVGRGLDRFGRRPFLLAAMWTYLLAMVLYALWDTVAGLVVGRAVQGAAAALLWVSVRTWIADRTPVAVRAAAMGGMTEASVRGSLGGAALAFTLIGFLGPERGWVASFVLFALSALVAGQLLRHRTAREAGPLPPSPGARARGEEDASVDPLLLAVLSSSLASAVCFPFVLLSLHEATGGELARLAIWLLPVAAVMAFLPSRAGRLSDRFGAPAVVPGALAIAALASVGLAWASSSALLVTGLVLVVAGTAAVEPAFAARAGGTERDSRGRRFGRFELASGLGAVAGPLTGGFLHDTLGPSGPFWLSAAALLVALGVGVRVLGRR